MDRRLIKNEAKEKLNGNKLNIWKPLLVIIVIGFLLGFVASIFGVTSYDINGNPTVGSYFIDSLSSLIGSVLSVFYIYYMIGFIKTGKFMTIGEAFKILKDKWLIALLGYILISIFTTIGFVLLIVPGIIVALGFSMFFYIVADMEVTDVMDGLKKSWEMMKGYKWDYFVFSLSFIGWFLLVVVSLGIALIWVVPYMQTAYTIYYLKLKEIKNM